MDISKRLHIIVILLAFTICFIAIKESLNFKKEEVKVEQTVSISNILQKARKKAQETLQNVKHAMGIDYEN